MSEQICLHVLTSNFCLVVLYFPNKKETTNKDRLYGHPQINIAAIPKSSTNFSSLCSKIVTPTILVQCHQYHPPMQQTTAMT
jgi:hypothetical protein